MAGHFVFPIWHPGYKRYSTQEAETACPCYEYTPLRPVEQRAYRDPTGHRRNLVECNYIGEIRAAYIRISMSEQHAKSCVLDEKALQR
jgi:hypothetical protein